ncbi:MAG: hypothetical protein QXS54_04155 [Candidatus Methanomethylicaceae archaeon]
MSNRLLVVSSLPDNRGRDERRAPRNGLRNWLKKNSRICEVLLLFRDGRVDFWDRALARWSE